MKFQNKTHIVAVFKNVTDGSFCACLVRLVLSHKIEVWLVIVKGKTKLCQYGGGSVELDEVNESNMCHAV
ncbi:CLUMA_CG020230, isoform A [Clunio marinus]|uniref:CLUMA_CG020230, isoform A n=1 Tax=Clunio marinus TaxID=568069 RepID=A0A1J1J5L3_9DIPT|nr:CLUMA_CG020230, isoform A [Clunio marinus]